MITSAAGRLLLASTMSTSFRVHYYVLGDDPDFCFPISVLLEDYIMELAQMIQKHYLEYTGVQLLFPKLFPIHKAQDEMADIADPDIKCMKFGKQVEDYLNWVDLQLKPDRVYILVIAGREWI
jgi:hypothetical protein